MNRKKQLTGGAKIGLGAAFLAGVVGYWFFEDNQTAPTVQASQVETVEQKPVPVARKMNINGRDYFFWEGMVVEEFDNSQFPSNSYDTEFDHHIYDFNLGVVLHGVKNHGGVTKTLFNNLKQPDGMLPPHIDHVRKIGCDIAQSYNARAAADSDEEIPGDISYFFDNHCSDYSVSTPTPAP